MIPALAFANARQKRKNQSRLPARSKRSRTSLLGFHTRMSCPVQSALRSPATTATALTPPSQCHGEKLNPPQSRVAAQPANFPRTSPDPDRLAAWRPPTTPCAARHAASGITVEGPDTVARAGRIRPEDRTDYSNNPPAVAPHAAAAHKRMWSAARHAASCSGKVPHWMGTGTHAPRPSTTPARNNLQQQQQPLGIADRTAPPALPCPCLPRGGGANATSAPARQLACRERCWTDFSPNPPSSPLRQSINQSIHPPFNQPTENHPSLSLRSGRPHAAAQQKPPISLMARNSRPRARARPPPRHNPFPQSQSQSQPAHASGAWQPPTAGGDSLSEIARYRPPTRAWEFATCGERAAWSVGHVTGSSRFTFRSRR